MPPLTPRNTVTRPAKRENEQYSSRHVGMSADAARTSAYATGLQRFQQAAVQALLMGGVQLRTFGCDVKHVDRFMGFGVN
jgi:hypothetical protein